MYANAKCKKCGQYVSIEIESLVAIPKYGYLLTNKNHQHCIDDIIDNEKVICDVLSITDEPHPEAVDVIHHKK